jgi:UDP-glucose 4-epimerase
MKSLSGTHVMVTGADGFIGSHVVERLVTEGANVRAFCYYNSQGSWGWLDHASADLQARLDVVLGDIRDARAVRAACEGVEIIIHLAALVSIPYSYQAPASFVDTNVIGTMNVLEAAKDARCRRVVHTSTSEVYGTPETTPIRETHPLRAQSPYSATKIAADMLCEAYARSFETPVVIVRPFNTYGPRQSARAVVPTILSQLLTGSREVVLGNTSPRRDLTYIVDTVDAFARAAVADLLPGETVHLGTGRTYSVMEVFETACRVLDVDAEIVTDKRRIRPERSEVLVLESDPQRAADRLDWTASTSLEDGIRETAAWLGDWMHRYKPEIYGV